VGQLRTGVGGSQCLSVDQETRRASHADNRKSVGNVRLLRAKPYRPCGKAPTSEGFGSGWIAC